MPPLHMNPSNIMIFIIEKSSMATVIQPSMCPVFKHYSPILSFCLVEKIHKPMKEMKRDVNINISKMKQIHYFNLTYIMHLLINFILIK